MLVDFGVNPCATNSIGEGSPDLVHAVYQHIREQSEEVTSKKTRLHLQTHCYTVPMCMPAYLQMYAPVIIHAVTTSQDQAALGAKTVSRTESPQQI